MVVDGAEAVTARRNLEDEPRRLAPCSSCGRESILRDDGLIRIHRDLSTYVHKGGIRTCEGSHKPPGPSKRKVNDAEANGPDGASG